jgi:hypothetical protein
MQNQFFIIVKKYYHLNAVNELQSSSEVRKDQHPGLSISS